MNIKETLKHIIYIYEYDEDTGEVMPTKYNESGLWCIFLVVLALLMLLVGKF